MAELSTASSVPRITRAARTVPAPAPAAEEDGAVLSAAKTIGSGALSGLSMVGNLLDLPGSMVRDALVWDNPLNQLLDPLSHSSTGRSASGRDVLARNILTSSIFTPNKETGIGGWGDDPLEGVQDVAGFAVELATDPLSWFTGGVAKTPGTLGDLSHAITTPAKAGILGKLDKGLSVINELDPGTHVGRALGIPQALAKRKFIGPHMAGTTTLADKSLESIASGLNTARTQAGRGATAAYDAAPVPVQAVADWVKTEAGKKSDAMRRWALSAFNHRKDNRMVQTGQESAEIMTGDLESMRREFIEPLVATIGDVDMYGPDGFHADAIKLSPGITPEDWSSDYSDSLMHALETQDTSFLKALHPGGHFVESYNRLRSTADNILQRQRDAGVNVGELDDVIGFIHRQMNARLEDWHAARKVGETTGSGTTTREPIFKGFYQGTGGRVGSGVNRVTSDPEILQAVRDSAQAAPLRPGLADLEAGPEAAGARVAEVISRKYAGEIDPRLPKTAKETGDLSYTIPGTATNGNPPAVHKITPSELKANYDRVPESAPRDFSKAAGDAFDLPAGSHFDMNDPLHREFVFREGMPLEFTLNAAAIADKSKLPQTIHQETLNRWEEIGKYLWGSDDALESGVQRMKDHTNQVETNGGIFGGNVLINFQKYITEATARTATANHFTDVFEIGLKNGQVRVVSDKMTPAALAETEGRGLERSAGVQLKDVFNQKSEFNKQKIYENSFERLRKSDPATFDQFMKVPDDLGDDAVEMIDELGEEAFKKLDKESYFHFMDNLYMDKQLSEEIVGLHRATKNQSVPWEKFRTLMETATSQWKATVLSMAATQVRNFTGGILQNMTDNNWSGRSQASAHHVLFNQADESLADLPEVVAYMTKRKLDPSDPMSLTQAAREMYAIEKGHTASYSRDFAEQANTADNMVDMEHLFGMLPGHRNVRGHKDLLKEFLGTLAGKRNGATWTEPFGVAGTTRIFGKNAGKIRRESTFAPVVAHNIWGKATDDVNRLQGWIEGQRRGMSSREAYAKSNRAQLDYDPRKFTDFERQLRTIFPFYSFFSRETAYVANELMTNPAGGLGKLIRAMRHAETSDYLPEHVREGGAVQVGESEDGTKNYITNFGLMPEDTIKTLTAGSASEFGRGLLSKMNPLLKAPIEYSLGRSSFQGGPLGGRDLSDMDPTLGRIATGLGLQRSLPNQSARPIFGSPLLEHISANAPTSRIFSTIKTLMEPSERKSIIDKAANTLTGLRITSVSPEQKQRGIRELTNVISKELGSRAFTTFSVSKDQLEDAKKNDPEAYRKLQAVKILRKHFDKLQRAKRKQQEIDSGATEAPTQKDARTDQSRILSKNRIKMSRQERERRIAKAVTMAEGTDSYFEALTGVPNTLKSSR